MTAQDRPTTAPSDSASQGPRGRASRPLLDVDFTTIATFHPVELVSPGFVLASTGHAVMDTMARFEARIEAPFIGVELEIRAPRSSGTAVAGVHSADGLRGVQATLTPTTGVVTLELLVDGETIVLDRTHGDPVARDCALALTLCENQATVLVRDGHAGWRALLTERSRIADRLDFRRATELVDLGFVWGAREGSVRLGNATAGVFGMAGLRDPHLVQHADGTPFVEDGKVYLTWTCAGLGSFPQAHWGVFRLDPADPTSLEQVAHLFASRDGLVVGDHAGQLVRDDDAWLVANTSWGDFTGSGVHVRTRRSKLDLLHGVHVLDTLPAALPTTLSSWDPCMTRIDGTWYVAFVESPSQSPFDFHPALARTSRTAPFRSLTRVAAARNRHQTEGTVLARDREGWKVLGSDGTDRCFRVYDLALRDLGTLDAPYGSNIPHPQVVPRRDGGWLLVTFDGTSYFKDVVGYGAHGSVVVMRST